MSTIEQSQLDIDAVIDSAPIGRKQWSALILCSLVAMLDGFDLQLMSFVAPIISEKYALDSASMGQVLASALAGLMIGSFVASPISDRVGRKPVIIGACAVMGVFSLLTVSGESAGEFILYRFLTGVGLGGALPSIQTYTSEIVPQRNRALLMTIMFLGFPFGAIIGGVGSAPLIAAVGWQAPFIVGGVLPLALALVLLVKLSESIRWLAKHEPTHDSVRAYMRRSTELETIVEDAYGSGSAEHLPVISVHPLSSTALPLTLFLWFLFFSNLMLLYTLLTWLPSLMSLMGFSVDGAIFAAVLFNVGGAIGGLLLSFAMDRYGSIRSLLASYVMTMICLPVVAILELQGPLLFLGIFLLGIPVAGTPFGVSALAASLYSTAVRGRGVGWGLAVGRFGAVLGPLGVGYLLTVLNAWEIILVSIVPAFWCLVATFFLWRHSRRHRA